MPECGPKALLRNSPEILPPSSISEEELQDRSRRAQSLLLGCFPPRDGDSVAIYSPLEGEVGTDLIAGAVRQCGGQVYYPAVTPDGGMSFFPAGPGERMVRGLFGVPVPEASRGRDGKRDGFDLMVVPGKAFDGRGYRLGRGGGYYDRLLSRATSRWVIGLAFSWQIVQEVPIDPWDVPMAAVVTENGVIRVSVETEDPRACK